MAADRQAKTEALSHAKHAPFSMLSDPDLKVIRTWGVREAGKQKIAAPCMFLLARGGKVLWRYLGKSMSDRPDLDEVLRIIDRLVAPR